MNTKQTIKKVADKLLEVNNTVTTLEIKVELRNKYPNYKWKQKDVSEAMSEFHLQGLYEYTDNGVFRVYSAVKNSLPTKKVKTTDTTSKKSALRVSRTKALELIQNNSGRFFGVTFTKKDGSVRKMKCKLEKNKSTPSSLGYLLVVDTTSNSPKSLNLQTISELRMNKNVYKVA